MEFVVLRTGNVWGCVPEEIGWRTFQGSAKGGVARAGFESSGERERLNVAGEEVDECGLSVFPV